MSNRVVLVTGAARGLGAAVARRFLDAGYRVAPGRHCRRRRSSARARTEQRWIACVCDQARRHIEGGFRGRTRCDARALRRDRCAREQRGRIENRSGHGHYGRAVRSGHRRESAQRAVRLPGFRTALRDKGRRAHRQYRFARGTKRRLGDRRALRRGKRRQLSRSRKFSLAT